MDFTEGDYCRRSKTLLVFLGQWPYQEVTQRNVRSIYSATIIGSVLSVQPYLLCYRIKSQCCRSVETAFEVFRDNFTAQSGVLKSHVNIFQLLKMIRSFRDLDIFECIPPIMTTTNCFTKLLVLIINRKKFEKFLNQMNDDWKGQTDLEEIEIMKRYMSQGKLYATVYTYFMYVTLATFILFIFEPHVLNIVSPLNETRPLKMLYPAELFIDEEKYYAWITFVSILTAIFGITVLIANDTMLIIYVQYICGMLAIVGHRLEFTLYKLCNENRAFSDRDKEVCNRYIRHCVHTHRKALNLVSLLESTFMTSQLIQLGTNVLSLSVTLVRVVALLGSFEIFRYILYAIGQLLHLLYVNYQSQRLIDHSLGLSRRVYSGKWYSIPKDTQRMLLFLLQRSNIPSYLTAGKVFVFSMENFSMVLQNSMSCFMVLISLE